MFYTLFMKGAAWCKDFPDSPVMLSTVQRQSGSNRHIHDCHAQMVVLNGGPGQAGVHRKPGIEKWKLKVNVSI